jgi:virulence factor Mce-like protein
MSDLRAGVIALVVIAIAVFLGFTKDIPFTKPFEVKAVFQSANSIRPNSPVRIAGVNVGKVQSVEAQEGTDAAVVTMMIKDEGLPLHTDATAKIRPRIFLEGNFFVDLHPGTPQAPKLEDGDAIKVTRTATPVQLDEVLTSLQEDTRQDLKDVLHELSIAFEKGAPALNRAYENAGSALRTTAIVNEALLGVEPDRDVQRLLTGLTGVSQGLTRNETQLKDLITNLNTTMGAFASEQSALRTSIRELGPTLQQAHAALGSLNDAFPATRAFAREILPGVRETPATIHASFPWITQARGLMRQSELRGLAQRLSPASRDLAKLVNESERLLPQADLLSQCFRDVILPTGDIPIKDDFETGAPNYKEFFYTLVGLSGESQNFDANGVYVRFQPGGGSNTISLGGEGTPSSKLFGNAFPGGGAQPKKPAQKPPYNDKVACKDSKIPDLNGPWAAKGDTQNGGGEITRVPLGVNR